MDTDKTKRQKHSGMKFYVIFFVGMACFSVGLFVVLGLIFSSSEPYKMSIEMLESNAEIMEYLGADYKRTGTINGRISGRSADLSYKLSGKNGISRVDLYAINGHNGWEFMALYFYYDEAKPERINLVDSE